MSSTQRVSKRFFELERLAIVRVVLCVGKREALLTPLRVPDNWDRHAYLVLEGLLHFMNSLPAVHGGFVQNFWTEYEKMGFHSGFGGTGPCIREIEDETDTTSQTRFLAGDGVHYHGSCVGKGRVNTDGKRWMDEIVVYGPGGGEPELKVSKFKYSTGEVTFVASTKGAAGSAGNMSGKWR